jgi:CubicO group peptidase (beta-lactamase class C family)
VRHVLTHTAGVPALPAGTTLEQFCDADAMARVIADLEPWWTPGEGVGYHALTFGFILGEVVRRATGLRISQALAEDVAGPLGVADEVYFGVPDSALGRVAPLEDDPAWADRRPGLTGAQACSVAGWVAGERGRSHAAHRAA